MLFSVAGDLEIVEAVDKPNMLVVMRMPKHVFTGS